MSKLSNKHMVEKIKKLALDPFSLTGPAPNAAPGASSFVGPPAPPGTYTPAPTGSGGPRDVAKMQMELRNLANAVNSQIAAPAPGASQQEKNEADSRLAFNNFIAEHYVRPAGGVEFDAAPSQTQMANKNPNQPTRMNMLADTMSRIGGSSNEISVDNNWGPRTNGALQAAAALAAGLLKMTQDPNFHITSQFYDNAQLAQFKDAIPYKDTDLTPQEKIERAQLLVPYIIGIRHLFNEVQQHILNKPAYRSYIEGDQAYLTYKAQPTSQLAPQQVEALKQKFPNGFSVPLDQQGKQNAQFTVDDLVNLASLNKKIDSVNAQYQVKLDPYNTLTAISNQIGGS
jgi:hypothetical protein